MTKLLKKDLVLAMHPTVPMMVLLAAMVLIPNYPYSVSFFYVELALFFTCLQGRENHDVPYSVTLPVSRRQIVHARILFAVIIQMVQLVLLIPLSMLSRKINPTGNLAGLDASPALFAVGFLIFGVFNFVFFRCYYKNVNRVGVSFLLGAAVTFLLVIAEVVSSYAIPFVRDVLDTTNPAALPAQFTAAAVGGAIYVLLTALACKRSAALFERQDL